MKRLWWVLAAFAALASCAQLPTGLSDREKLYWQAPVLLPGVTPDLRQPGFWISRLESPDTPILTSQQIQKFEQELEDRNLVTHLPLLDSQPLRTPLADLLKQDAEALPRIKLYLADGRLPEDSWRQAVRHNLNLAQAGTLPVRYALAVSWCEQRYFPVQDVLTVEPLDADFDDSQLSAYDVGTPFAVCHESADGKWVWVRGRLSDGWVQKDRLAMCTEADLTRWQNRRTVTVTALRADCWLDSGGRTWGGWVRMGTALPLESESPIFWQVTLPVRNSDGTLAYQSAWIPKNSAGTAPLPCTPRNIVNQAFLFLDRSYGWADMYGEQDCSRFLVEVFASVGIGLPRNSLFQSQAGVGLAHFHRPDPVEPKVQAVLAAVPVRTLIRLDGHIMLYLGQLNGRPYAIHTLWAYRQKDSRGEILRSVNRTAVSPLDLGQGTSRGSLADRILDLRDIRPTDP